MRHVSIVWKGGAERHTATAHAPRVLPLYILTEQRLLGGIRRPAQGRRSAQVAGSEPKLVATSTTRLKPSVFFHLQITTHQSRITELSGTPSHFFSPVSRRKQRRAHPMKWDTFSISPSTPKCTI
jgi:hypothetical protein